ncbi:unnamed protein product [Protopolystoma xenopodis]|uniref:Uncharacterized protein n=1 Tax=Protopolystoma xenopodis TaxID=117903 RepID=A0A3S5C586_9PLAT|nr:unnamed protein product [Protopolystoma xenopodis]
MENGSAHFYPNRGRTSRGLRQPERGIEDKQLRFNANPTSSSGEIDLRSSSASCTCIQNQCRPKRLTETLLLFISEYI